MQNFFNFYTPFFNIHNWGQVLNSKQSWLIILSLIILECMMSLDNAVVLAAQTKILPTKKQQEKSLLYGLLGAYIFRFIAIGLGSYLIKFWILKVLGAIYLIWLSLSYFIKKSKKSTQKKIPQINGISLFWRVVISIELMDIAFSIDSVLASLALSENPIILLLGGIIGILTMRLIAGIISNVMEVIPELISSAYALIIFIGIKLFLSIPAIDFEIPNLLFLIFTIFIFAITLLIHFLKKRASY